eukprot:gene1153-2233_t
MVSSFEYYIVLLWLTVQSVYAFSPQRLFTYCGPKISYLPQYAKNEQGIADEIKGWGVDFQHHFLSCYWQKKPLMIRSAFDMSKLLIIGADDLISLSQEEDVESRLIFRKGDKWKKEYGPFESTRFESLKKGNWTVLVQEVDRHVPSMADIWSDHFRFIPSWRRDDIMMSYATPDGGIGAHVDNYDVFLIQGRGRRRWSIENSILTEEEEREREVKGVDTRLLKDFQEDQYWDLEPGDMLYLPPRVPHRGVSLGGECITVSMGLRAPSQRSMVIAFCDHVCQTKVDENEMYSDSNMALQSSQGYIAEGARLKIASDLTDKLTSVLEDRKSFDSWLGSYLTTPLRMQLRFPGPFFLKKDIDNNDSGSGSGSGSEEVTGEETFTDSFEDDEDLPMPLALSDKYRVASTRIFDTVGNVLEAIEEGSITLRRAEWVKSAYMEQSLFLNGKEYSTEGFGDMAGELLCEARTIDGSSLRQCLQGKGAANPVDSKHPAIDATSFRKLITTLIKEGHFYPVDITC